MTVVNGSGTCHLYYVIHHPLALCLKPGFRLAIDDYQTMATPCGAAMNLF